LLTLVHLTLGVRRQEANPRPPTAVGRGRSADCDRWGQSGHESTTTSGSSVNVLARHGWRWLISNGLWNQLVQLTITVGERILAPIERFIGRRSLVGDATFFPLERFPWTAHIEQNWTVIREEVERLLDDHEYLPNFQDISKDQIEITDDDRWKTLFLYGYGFTAELGVQLMPQTAALMREIPGMTTAMISILSPRKHILDHRGPYKGVLRYHLGLIVPEDAQSCRIRVGDDIRHWEEGRSLIFDDTFNHEVWNDTDETRVVLFVDVLRPLPFPESFINRMIIRAIGISPFVLDAKRNQQAWERRYLERRRDAETSSAARDLVQS
jgi:ornithine lipid ester-linked acyl 2-hydroxylase